MLTARSSITFSMRLPQYTLRDHINQFVLDVKFKWIPFRGYYRFRSYKYMKWIDPEMGLLRYVVDPRRISLDVGANHGLFTHFLARYSPHVHAFEPNPLPFNVLKRVVDRNVTVYHMALTDRTSDVELVVPRGRKGWTNNGASLDRKREGHFAIVKVPGSRIDDLDLKDIGFIKIDVEGHENIVLKGAIATLQRDRPNLFLENEYAHVGAAADEVFRLLRDLNYDGFFLGDGVVKHISHFSWEQYQIGPRRESGRSERYVKNFIFIPKEGPSVG